MNSTLYQQVAVNVLQLELQICELPSAAVRDKTFKVDGYKVQIPISPRIALLFPRMKRFSLLHESRSDASAAWVCEVFHSFAAPLLENVGMNIRLAFLDEVPLLSLADLLSNRKAFPNLRYIGHLIQMISKTNSCYSPGFIDEFRARCPGIECMVTVQCVSYCLE